MNQDYRDLLLALNAANVEYLVVGAHALAAYGHVRATNDLDIWIKPTEENADKVLAALKSFGAPLLDLSRKTLVAPDTVFQIGVNPVRIDLLTSIDGVEFGEAWTERSHIDYSGVPSLVISRTHLIANKKAVGRLQDLADVERLEEKEE